MFSLIHGHDACRVRALRRSSCSIPERRRSSRPTGGAPAPHAQKLRILPTVSRGLSGPTRWSLLTATIPVLECQ